MTIAVDWDVKPQTKLKTKSRLLDQILIIYETFIQNIHFGMILILRQFLFVHKLCFDQEICRLIGSSVWFNSLPSGVFC